MSFLIQFTFLHTAYLLISLTFVAFKPQFTKKLNDVKAKENDTVTFVCEMSQEDLTPIWMKGGQKLSASQKYQLVTDKKVQKLIIRDVTIQDKAEYTCIYGETSTWAKLVVEGELVWKEIYNGNSSNIHLMVTKIKCYYFV